MHINQRLPVFITEAHPCSYLEGKQARTAFVDPSIPISRGLASALNLQGFRRSGRYLYKTSCDNCNACQPLRVDVNAFRPNKSQRRNWRNNADLQVKILSSGDIDNRQRTHYYDLYQRYICARHDKGDMFPPDEEQFEGFIGRLYDFSRIIEFSLGDQIVMAALCDELEDGYSAIYTFFEPTLSHRGLGVYAVLWQIEHCVKLGLPYLYMGFWIEDCSKMNYKSKYRPNEIFCSDQWQSSSTPGKLML